MTDTEKKIAELQREIERLKEERDIYKSSSEVFYERLKKVDEERNRLFERLKVIKTSLGGVTFTDVREQEEKLIKKLREITNARLWSAYNAICDIVEDIEKEFSK